MTCEACSFDEDQSGSLFRSSFRVLNLEKERINNVLKTYRFGDGSFRRKCSVECKSAHWKAKNFNLFQISFPSSSCPRYECNDQFSPQPFRLPLPMRLQSTMIEPSIVGAGKL